VNEKKKKRKKTPNSKLLDGYDTDEI
jgi:hypothetical protein